MAALNASLRLGEGEVAAIVLNYGREADTVCCVQALERSGFAGLRVWIVDNASPDGSGERLRQRFPEHRYLQTGGNFGYAGGNARGMAAAMREEPEFLLVLNEDTEPAPDMIARLVDALRRAPDAAAAAPLMLHEGSPARVWWGGGMFRPWSALATHEHAGALAEQFPPDASAVDVTSLCGCCILFRADVVRQHGGFIAEFDTYGEDVEISLRLRRAGYRLLFVPGARIVHKVVHPEPPPTPRKIRLRDRNRRRIVRAHYGPSQQLMFWGWFYPTRLVLAVGYLWRRDRARLAALWAGMMER